MVHKTFPMATEDVQKRDYSDNYQPVPNAITKKHSTSNINSTEKNLENDGIEKDKDSKKVNY